MAREFWFSLRLLWKRPGFAAVVIGCLALGIGANSAIFSLLNALLLQGLPVQKAERLAILHRGAGIRFSFPDYQDLAGRFAQSGTMLATIATESSLDRAGYQGKLVTAEAVTGNYASVLGAGAALGTWFDNEDSPVAVISYEAWQELFRGDPRVLGQQVRSETQWYTVIGVAPKDYRGLSLPRFTSIWVPLHFWTRQYPNFEAALKDRTSPLVTVVARLAPGIEFGQAAAQMGAIGSELTREEHEENGARERVTMVPLRGVTNGRERAVVKQVMGLLFAVVGVVLLICCVNVGNLLLVRGASRRREIGIRYSLGATRWRIVRQLLADGVAMAFLGAAGGLAAGIFLDHLILKLLPASPMGEAIRPEAPVDWRVLAFVAASALVTVFLFGLMPALRASSVDVSAEMRNSLSTPQGVRLRKSSVVVEVALSFLLLVVAVLFLDTCWRLEGRSAGFETANRLYATTYISKPEFASNQFAPFYEQVLADLRAMPGVRAAGLTYLLPLDAYGAECVSAEAGERFEATESTISPGFLKTLGIPVFEGRDFAETDKTNSTPVVLINKALSDRLGASGKVVGRRIRVGCGEPKEAMIAGVTANTRTRLLRAEAEPHVYLPFAQNATGLANIVIETSAAARSMTDSLRRALLEEGHGMRVYAVNSLAQHVADSYWQLRWEAWLLAGFGTAALLLAGLGICGVVSYGTSLRMKEFGVRVAMGAQARDILRLVLGEGVLMATMGVGIGMASVLAISRLLRGYLFLAGSSVAVSCLEAGLGWMVIVVVACYAPAKRSSHVDPAATLRHE